MKYFDAFSGVGTFSKVLDELGFDNVGWSEFNNAAIRAYCGLYPQHKSHYKDFTKIDWDEVEDFDLFVGGFPCQPFSRSGKRLGFLDEDKGNLFLHILRAIDKKSPSKILLENVGGLLTHDGGHTFDIVIRELNKRGYFVSWSLIDSRWQSSQSRKRVYIFATKSHQKISVFSFDDEISMRYNQVDIRDEEPIKGSHRGELDINGKGWYSKKRYISKNFPFSLQDILQDRDKIDERVERLLLTDEQIRQQQKYKGGYTSKNGHKAAPLQFPDKITNPSRTLLRSEGVRELIVIADSIGKYRKLSSLEYVRLQGFEDSFHEKLLKIGLTHIQIKQLMGNGVNLPTITKILNNL